MPLNHCLRVTPPVCIHLVVDFSTAIFSVPFFPASFLLVIIPVIDFHFVTATLISFLPFIFPPGICTSLISCLVFPPSFSTVTFSPSPSCMSCFLSPLSLLSSSFLCLQCSVLPFSLSPLFILPFFAHSHLPPLTMLVSLAISAARQSTVHHPTEN